MGISAFLLHALRRAWAVVGAAAPLGPESQENKPKT